MFRISKSIFKEVIKFCEEGYPFEVCGVLLGQTKKEFRIVQKVLSAKNLNRERAKDRYELDPKDFLKADQLARKEGLEIIGIYHSHPDHPPNTSKTDTERAWEGYSYLILAVREGKLDSFKCWRLNEDIMLEEPVEVIDGKS